MQKPFGTTRTPTVQQVGSEATLRQAIRFLNRLINSETRLQSEEALRQILQTRASGRRINDSLQK